MKNEWMTAPWKPKLGQRWGHSFLGEKAKKRGREKKRKRGREEEKKRKGRREEEREKRRKNENYEYSYATEVMKAGFRWEKGGDSSPNIGCPIKKSSKYAQL